MLLVEELRLQELVEKRKRLYPEMAAPVFQAPGIESSTVPAPSDLMTSWAWPWIQQVIRLEIPGLESLPDQSFRPDAAVTRATYARVNEGILAMLSGDDELQTRYVGERVSRFPDVRSDHFAYNAMAVVVDRGIMAPERVTGRFRPDDTISGAEALSIIRELQNAVRIEY